MRGGGAFIWQHLCDYGAMSSGSGHIPAASPRVRSEYTDRQKVGIAWPRLLIPFLGVFRVQAPPTCRHPSAIATHNVITIRLFRPRGSQRLPRGLETRAEFRQLLRGGESAQETVLMLQDVVPIRKVFNLFL